jgi:hypothetical protein
MRIPIKAITATALIIVLVSSRSYGQEMYAGSPAKTIDANINIAENNSTKGSTAIDPVIVAKFVALFPTATNQHWSVNDNSFWVSFVNNGRKTNASLTTKGKINYVITDCAMEQLPASFSKTIIKDYSSYTLYNAIEIKAYEAVAYQVILENASSYITLKYTDEGVEEIRQVKKVN